MMLVRVLVTRLGNLSIAAMGHSVTPPRVSLRCTHKCSSLLVPNHIATLMMMPLVLLLVQELTIQSHFVLLPQGTNFHFIMCMFCNSNCLTILEYITYSFLDSFCSLKSSTDSSPKGTDSASGSRAESSAGQSELASTSWMADMATATAASTGSHPFAASKALFFVAVTFILSLLAA